MASSTVPRENVALQILVFSIDTQYWGVEVKHVDQVVQSVAPAPTPHTPPGIRGIDTQHGGPTVVIDSGVVFGDEQHSGNEHPAVIIDRGGEPSMSLSVETIHGVYTVPTDYIALEYDRGEIPADLTSILCTAVIENTDPEDTTLPTMMNRVWLLSPNAIALGIFTSIYDYNQSDELQTIP